MTTYEREMKLIEIEIIAQGVEGRLEAIKKSLEKAANGTETEERLHFASGALAVSMEQLRVIESLVKLLKE